MIPKAKILAVAISLAVGPGCMSTYSSIVRVDENTYLLTKNKLYPTGVVKGVLLSCTPSGDSLRCSEVE